MIEKFAKCEKCGADYESKIEGMCYSVTCPVCGWGFATTRPRTPLESDQTVYELIIDNSTPCTLDNIKIVAHLFNVNFLQAKEMLSSISDYPIEALAADIIETTDKLTRANISYVINPEFPH